MKKIMILGTLAAALAGSYAQAAVMPLQNAIVTASYNGQADGMTGLDNGFAAIAGSNVTALDPTDGGEVEFLSADGLFGFDFSHAGLLNVWSNNLVMPSGDYKFVFDFGATLPMAISAFTLQNNSEIGGTPLFSVIDGHTIGLDLSGVTWEVGYGMFSSQISLAAPNVVPEPAGTALLLTGLAGMALARRRKARG